MQWSVRSEAIDGVLTCQVEGGKETSQEGQRDDDTLPRRAELAIARRGDCFWYRYNRCAYQRSPLVHMMLSHGEAVRSLRADSKRVECRS
jgi:hypothetical protein